MTMTFTFNGSSSVTLRPVTQRDKQLITLLLAEAGQAVFNATLNGAGELTFVRVADPTGLIARSDRPLYRCLGCDCETNGPGHCDDCKQGTKASAALLKA